MTSTDGREAAPSLIDEVVPAKPRVLPPNQLVILRESDLDCDLQTAIDRVRESSEGRGSRILIVGPERGAEGAENREEALPFPRFPMSVGQVARAAGQRAVVATGERMRLKVETLDCLLREAKSALRDLEAVSSSGQPERLRCMATAEQTLGWLQANVDDLVAEIRDQERGFSVVDLNDLLADTSSQIESFFPRVRINTAPVNSVCWGAPAELAEALFLLFVMVAHRIGGDGAVNVEVYEKQSLTCVRIFGHGAPSVLQASDQTMRVREVIAAHSGSIVPDEMGPHGAGLILQLPRAPQNIHVGP